MRPTHPVISLAAAGALLSSSAIAGLKAPVRIDNLKPDKLEGPEFADLDGDGKKDLISGLYSGNLLFRQNVGTQADPKFAEAAVLKSGGKEIKIKHW